MSHNIMQGLDKYKEIKRNTRKPVELHACVDEIASLSDSSRKFNYPHWCRIIKQSGLNYGQILELIKTAKSLPEKYSKTGYIFNKLR